MGYDQILMNGLQLLFEWNKSFDSPSGMILGLFVSSLYFGQLLSSPMTHWLFDRFGRRFTIAVGSLGVTLGTLITCFADLGPTSNESKAKAMFIAGRAIVGMSFRIPFFACMTLISELAHPRLRGISASLYILSYNIGGISASVITVSPVVLISAIYYVIPESHRWFISRGTSRREEAIRIMARYHANGDCEDELVRREVEEIMQHVRERKELSGGSLFQDQSQKGSWTSLIRTPGNRRRTLLVILSTSGVLLLAVGGIVRNYFTVVLRSVGVTEPAHIAGVNIAISAWYAITLVVGGLLVDKAGRRPLYLATTAGLLVTLAMIIGLLAAFESSSLAIINIVVFFAFSSFHQAGCIPLYTLYLWRFSRLRFALDG